MPSVIPILYHIGRTPGQNQFGLVQFTDHYKSDSDAEYIAGYTGPLYVFVPSDPTSPVSMSTDIGSVHPTYDGLFITDRHLSETTEKSSLIDLVYTGCYASGSGNLPAQQHSSEHIVASATSYTSDLIWPVIATIPAVLQFYAQSNTLIYFWPDATTWTDQPDDPELVTSDQVITWTLYGTQPASSIPGLVDWLLNHAYVQAITKTSIIREPVAGQYYQITVKKTRTLLPYAPAS